MCHWAKVMMMMMMMIMVMLMMLMMLMMMVMVMVMRMRMMMRMMMMMMMMIDILLDYVHLATLTHPHTHTLTRVRLWACICSVGLRMVRCPYRSYCSWIRNDMLATAVWTDTHVLRNCWIVDPSLPMIHERHAQVAHRDHYIYIDIISDLCVQ